MGSILPAVGGGVLLVLGLIYWKAIKPRVDKKREKKAQERERAVRKGIDQELSALLNLILGRLPVGGESVAIGDLFSSLWQVEEGQDAVPFDQSHPRCKAFSARVHAAINFGSNSTRGLIEKDGSVVKLTDKGKQKVLQGRK